MSLRRGLYGFAFVCSALALGLTLAHVLEIPGKRQLPGEEWLRVQQTFYFGYAVVGAIAEVGGLLASLGIVAIERRERVSTIWPIVSAIGFAGMLGTYFVGNRPLNDRIASWTPQTLSSDWSTVRDRWDAAHSISTLFAAIAFASLLAGFLASTRTLGPSEQPVSSGRDPQLRFDHASH